MEKARVRRSDRFRDDLLVSRGVAARSGGDHRQRPGEPKPLPTSPSPTLSTLLSTPPRTRLPLTPPTPSSMPSTFCRCFLMLLFRVI